MGGNGPTRGRKSATGQSVRPDKRGGGKPVKSSKSRKGSEENPIAARIREKLKERGITSRAASLMAGQSEYYVRDILNGRSTKQQAEPLHRLAIVLGVSPNWLLTGERDEGAGGSIPLRAYIASGGLVVAFDVGASELEHVPLPPGAVGVAGVAIVKGAHQQPAYSDGDLVFWGAHSTNPKPSNGIERVCMLTDGRIMLRSILAGTRPGRFHLVGRNAATLEDVELISAAPVLWIKKAQ